MPGDPGWEMFQKGAKFVQLKESQWPQMESTTKLTMASEIALGAFTVERYRLKVKDNLWGMRITSKLEHWDGKLRRIAYFMKTGRGILKYHYEGRMNAPKLKEYIPRIPDLYEAEMMFVREIQAKHFPEEIDLLLRIGIRDPNAQPELRKRNSSLLSINPFVDAQGVLQARGRLEFSTLRSFDSKHPMILPSHKEALESLIRKEHVQQLHAGINHIMASLRTIFFYHWRMCYSWTSHSKMHHVPKSLQKAPKSKDGTTSGRAVGCMLTLRSNRCRHVWTL
jgi:hypothetical protein